MLHGSQSLALHPTPGTKIPPSCIYDYRPYDIQKYFRSLIFLTTKCVLFLVCMRARALKHSVQLVSEQYHAKVSEMDSPDVVYLQTILHSATIWPQRYRIQSCYLNLKWRSALFTNLEELNFRHMSTKHPVA